MTRRWMAGLAAACAAVTIALLPSPASAASSGASKDNFAGPCDALVIVSDTTTYGYVEVFGGFSCPDGLGLLNHPVGATITVSIYRNGLEIIRSKKSVPMNVWPLTVSTDYHSVTYPDYEELDAFRGRIEISSLSGSATLMTGEIRT